MGLEFGRVMVLEKKRLQMCMMMQWQQLDLIWIRMRKASSGHLVDEMDVSSLQEMVMLSWLLRWMVSKRRCYFWQ